MPTPFDYVEAALSKNRSFFYEHDGVGFDLFIALRYLSMSPRTLSVAHEMNRYFPFPPEVQFRALLSKLERAPKPRWIKATAARELAVIARLYKVNISAAKEIRRVLSKRQIEEIMAREEQHAGGHVRTTRRLQGDSRNSD